MSRTTQLFELQQVDSQSDDLLRRALAINHALGETDDLRAAREAHAAVAATLAAGQAHLRALSHEVDEMTAHMDLMGKRLYDGSIKNPKELVAIQHDIGHMKEVRSGKEDLLLEAMEAVDGQQAALDAATQHLEQMEAEWRRSQDGLLEEKESVDTRLRALRTHREKLAAAVPWDDLQLYEKLRKAKQGVAVSAMEHDICQRCRVQISGSQAITAKQGREFVLCPSCGRILHPGARGELVRW
jgi:predicted  nucleic acid-binding Zn-ribbon protein